MSLERRPDAPILNGKAARERIAALEDALSKAADTLADVTAALRLFGKPVAAAATQMAHDYTLAVLDAKVDI